jgi:OOP family OmpA-OmpF porin
MSLFEKTWLLVAALTLAAPAARAQEPDAEGCKDSAVLSRMPGCRIAECDVKDFDAVEVQVGPQGESGFPMKRLEGRKEILTYVCGENVSSLQLVRNAEGALRKAAYTIVFSGKVEAGDEPGVTAQKGAQWVQVAGASGYSAPAGAYVLTAVRTKEMAQEMTATAEGLAADINRTGRVAVYGINFDTGKATIRPDSDTVLGEVAKLLKANAAGRSRSRAIPTTSAPRTRTRSSRRTGRRRSRSGWSRTGSTRRG